MQSDNLTIAYLVLELRPFLEGSFVNKVSEISSGTLKLKLHTKQGSKGLIISGNDFFLANFSAHARHGKTNFAVALKKELYNKRIIGIEQHSLDRVVEIRLLEHSLVLELMGEGNQILVGKDGKIISCARNEEWSDRKTRKGEPYAFPRAKGLNPVEIGGKELADAFSRSERQAIQALVSSVNISPLVAEEVFHSLKIAKSAKASGIAASDVVRIADKVKEFYTVAPEKLNPVAYRGFCYPFMLSHLSDNPVGIPSLNSFISDSLSTEVVSGPVVKEQKSESREKVSKLEFQRLRQAEARKKFIAVAEENQRKGEAIYRHYSEIEELSSAITQGVKKGFSEKEILSRISGQAKKGSRAALLLRRIDLKGRKFEIEVD